jgi:hypothetical protein
VNLRDWKNRQKPGLLLIAAALVFPLLAAFPAASEPNSYEVDPSTLDKKVMFGYQGWFACEGDGSDYGWNHWFRNGGSTRSDLRVEMWPDLTEYSKELLYDTQIDMPNGDVAQLYSPYNQETVDLHFKWMQDYELDGVFLQRFINNIIKGGIRRTFRNEVTKNVMNSAETYGRTWAMMYDVSGVNSKSDLVNGIKRDWEYLVDELKITQSPNYLHHNGKPVMAIWGLGVHNRPGTAEDAMELIHYFKEGAEDKYQVTLIGGVPGRWRGLGRDSKQDGAWNEVYLSFDIVLPWVIGRYRSASDHDAWMDNYTRPDLELLKEHGVEYLPVNYPGFSRNNMHIDETPADTFNSIPRDGGKFFWRQVYNNIDAGINMLYIAMFDEVDEATAMYKVVAKQEEMPTGVKLLALDEDGYDLPSDWYLRLSREAGRMLRGEIPIDSNIPITADESQSLAPHNGKIPE